MSAPYQLFDALPLEQYEALKADIARRGVMVPIEVDENGTILDGHHRDQICHELGIEAPTVVRSGLDDDGKREHVLKINLLRRHLGPISFAEAFRELCRFRGVELGQGKRNDHTSATVADVADEVGVSERTARHRLRMASELDGHPDLAARVDTGDMSLKRAQKLIRRRRADVLRSQPTEARTVVDQVDIRLGDFRDALGDLDGRVDAIIVDPPYGNEFLLSGGIDALGELAARLLTPTGTLALMFGNAYMARVIVALSAHAALHYRGFVAWHQPGPASDVQAVKLSTNVKPVLLYDRGVRDRWVRDLYVCSPGPEKGGHEWQQSAAGFHQLVERLTLPGDLVVDPCLGAGTTAVACRDLGRRFVGCDTDPAAVVTARRRLAGGGDVPTKPHGEPVTLCVVCCGPLDPWLPENGYDTHPTCGPTDDATTAADVTRLVAHLGLRELDRGVS